VSVPVLVPRRLVCPAGCGTYALDVLDVERQVPVGGGAATLHRCRNLAGMDVPLVPEGERAEARSLVREDYVGTDEVQYDADGRPIMAVEVVRDDGTDRAVFAPLARGAADG